MRSARCAIAARSAPLQARAFVSAPRRPAYDLIGLQEANFRGLQQAGGRAGSMLRECGGLMKQALRIARQIRAG